LGWDVSLADISTTMQDFAKWRLGRRNISASYYNTATEDLPADTFDVITACDVMAHVPDPRETLSRLRNALKVGGYLFFNVDARPRPSRETQWHLYRYAYPVLRPVRAVGFEREPRLQFFHVFRKVGHNPPGRIAAVTAYDTLRYNLAVATAGQYGRQALRQIREWRAARASGSSAP
jgi:SAM-dependent methyltransferase